MLSKARLKYLRSLRQKKVRREEGVLLVEGLNVVKEAVAAGCALEVLLTPDAAKRIDAPAVAIDERQAEALAQTRAPAGAFAVVKDFCRPFREADLPEEALLLVAAGVADPGNLGTLVRTAAAFGADAVVATAGSVDPGNAKAVRASAGLCFALPVLRGEPREVKEAGFVLWLADAGGAPPPARPARCALVVGNEPRGAGDDLRALADAVVRVEMRPGVESLNVAVAAGILLQKMGAR